MKFRKTVLVLALAALASMGCKKKDKTVDQAQDFAEVDLPTEEDFEEAAEAEITPETLDSEIAKLERELADTRKK